MVALTTKLLEKPEFRNQVKNIIKNGDSSSLTATQIRHGLESHFVLKKDALKEKPYKKAINEMIDDIYAKLQKDKGQGPQEHTPEATDSSREVSPVKPSSHKRKAASPEEKVKAFVSKKAKVGTDDEAQKKTKPKKSSPVKKQSKKVISDSEDEEEDHEEQKETKPKKSSPVKKQSKKVISDSEDEEDDNSNVQESSSTVDNKAEDEKMKDASDEDDKEENEDEAEEEEKDSFTPPPAKKRTTKKPIKSVASPTKSDDSIKRLKQFISKCGVRKVWAKELADCKSATAEVRKLKTMLEDLGVQGRPTLEKCEAVKNERELKAEVDSLDTDLIINETGRRTRTRNNAPSRPSYAVDDSSSSEEEEENDEEEDGSDDENKDNNAQESDNESEAKANDDNAKEESEDEESSEDEFKGDDSDDDEA